MSLTPEEILELAKKAARDQAEVIHENLELHLDETQRVIENAAAMVNESLVERMVLNPNFLKGSQK